MNAYTKNTPIQAVIHDPAFGDYGRLIFPVDEGYMSGDTLGSLRLTWYNNIDPDKTVEIANFLRTRALNGETIFYDIYTEEEKAADPAKRDSGLFFFKGTPGARFAVCNAGGGFAYVGAMQDSFPHALELSKKGYNAFALIYRTPTSWRSIPPIIPFGAARRADAWRRGSARMERRSSASRIIRALPPSFCNTRGTANTASLTRRRMPASGAMTVLQAGS